MSLSFSQSVYVTYIRMYFHIITTHRSLYFSPHCPPTLSPSFSSMASVRGAPTLGHFASYRRLSGDDSSSMDRILVLITFYNLGTDDLTVMRDLSLSLSLSFYSSFLSFPPSYLSAYLILRILLAAFLGRASE
jgi:hypothetical protein